MAVEGLQLPGNAREAYETVVEASRTAPVLVFKASPICGTSFRAEAELDNWLATRPDGMPLKLARVDVIKQRNVARGLTAEFGIRHESPQALLVTDGELRWHGSHGQLTAETFQEMVDTRVA